MKNLDYQIDYPNSEMKKVSDFVFNDWNVDPIPVSYNSRLSRYRGKYFQEFFAGQKIDEWIEIFKPKRLTYKMLYYVLSHELAHYVQSEMSGYTDHDTEFKEIWDSIYNSVKKEMS